MPEVWVRLNDIPAEGREFTFTDQSIWTGPWKDYSLPYTPGKPIQADLFILPQKDGCLVRGRIHGSVKLPCDRCAEDIEHQFDENFELFEGLTGETAEPGEETWLRRTGETIELNVAGLLWEQFLLIMPVHPVCSPDCKGICPGCGQNLNVGECTCPKDDADPRLAVLRNLKLS